MTTPERGQGANEGQEDEMSEKILGTMDAVEKIVRGFEVRPCGHMQTYFSLDYKKGHIVNGWGERQSWGIFDTATEWELYELDEADEEIK